MASNIHTRSRRFNLVKGQVTDTPDEGFVSCGDGTLHPLEVTLEQLVELMYRVRDAQLSSSLVVNGDPLLVAGTPPERLVVTNEHIPDYLDHLMARGHYRIDPADAAAPSFFNDPYTVTSHLWPTGDYREAKNELAMWTLASVSPLLGDDSQVIQTGFSLVLWPDSLIPFIDSGSIPAYYSVYGVLDNSPDPNDYEHGEFTLVFSKNVAWTDDDASGNPFSAGNRMFVGLTARSIHLSKYLVTSPFADGLDDGTEATDSFLVLSMLSGEPSARLYGYAPELTTGDITLTATKWWGFDGKFNTATGARL